VVYPGAQTWGGNREEQFTSISGVADPPGPLVDPRGNLGEPILLPNVIYLVKF